MGNSTKATPVRIKCGAHVADSLVGHQLDLDEWQFWRFDPAVAVCATGRGLLVQGKSSVDRRAFSGLVSRRLYPADAVLVCELKLPMGTEQEGTYGAVVHLCNRLVGDEVKSPEIPDNNGELTFGRFEDRVGWFRWYYDQTGGEFYKWKQGAEPDAPPLGTEAADFVTVRVEHSEPDSLLSAALLDDGGWRRVGEPVKVRKFFSSVELKVDAQRAGLTVNAVFRNCRMYPQPQRHPVRAFVGKENAPVRNAEVQLLGERGERVLAAGVTDDQGLVELKLDSELVFPIGGRFGVTLPDGKVLSETVATSGVTGIYPGDFWAVDPS